MAVLPTPKTKRGRPRLRPSDSHEDPREEILLAAAASFTAKGYTATSFTAIADDVGLQRASLYHHFASKDAILAEIARRHLDPLLDLLARLDCEDQPPALQLYRYLRIDLRHMLRAPYDLGGLFHLPEVRERDRFRTLWDAVDTIADGWTTWIVQGASEGTFHTEEPERVGLLLESSYFGVLGTPRARLRENPAATADGFARFALDALLTTRAAGDSIAQQALEMDGLDPSVD